MRQDEAGAGAERPAARQRVQALRLRERVRQSRMSASLAVLTVLGGFLVAFATTPEGFADDAFGRLVAGRLEAQGPGGPWRDVAPGEDVPFGHRLRTPVDSSAALDVRQGTVTLGPSTRAQTAPGTVELDRGRVLFEVGAFYLALAPDLVARGDGTWRLDADVNARVAVYEGSASATGGLARGQERPQAVSLRDWEQVGLVAGAVGEPSPLAYSVQDEWDAIHALGPIAVDEAVAATVAGIERTYGTDPRPMDFYTAFTVVDEGVGRALVRFDVAPGAGFGPPGDVLVAVLVSHLLAERAVLDVGAAVDEVDDLRAAGATWGVVLARRDLGVRDWVQAVDLSLREVELLGDDAPAPATPAGAPGGGPGQAPSPGTSPSPAPSPSPSEPSPTSSPSPEPTEEPTEEPTCPSPTGDPAGCAGDVVDELLETIDDLVPPLVEQAVPDPVERVLDGVVGGVRGVLDLALGPRGRAGDPLPRALGVLLWRAPDGAR